MNTGIPTNRTSTARLFVIVGIILITLVVTSIMVKEYEASKNEVKVGDVWETYVNANPFIKDDYRLRRVLSVKRDYIQYILNGKDTVSSSKEEFLKNSERLIEGQ